RALADLGADEDGKAFDRGGAATDAPGIHQALVDSVATPPSLAAVEVTSREAIAPLTASDGPRSSPKSADADLRKAIVEDVVGVLKSSGLLTKVAEVDHVKAATAQTADAVEAVHADVTKALATVRETLEKRVDETVDGLRK